MANNKKIILTILILLLGVFIINLNKNEYLKEINQAENIELAIYLGEEKTKNIPSKDSGYYYDLGKSSCTNGAYINWDSISWSPVVKNVTTYPTRCDIHFTKTYTEGILNGADPVIKDELIPVTIDSDGTVKKADLETPWYSYADKNWANAVITRNSYDVLNAEGKVHGATKEDGYVSFDGVDDYIDLGLENYDFGNQVTISLKFSLNTDGYYEFFNNVEAAGVGIFYNNKIAFEIYNEITNKYEFVVGPSLEIGKVYTITGIYDGTEMKLIINGETVGNLSISGNIKPSLMPFLIGANSQPVDNINFSNINVYQATIYNRAVTEEEISSLTEGKITNSEGLLKYVDFTNKTNYEANEVIPEEIIESYFVWIPKYRYQLWDLGEYEGLTEIDTNKVHEIPVIFGDYNTSDEKIGECTTPMESGATGSCQIGDYMTHPVFLSIPSTGFWVGKFETGYDGASSANEAIINTKNESKIVIKPNVYSWRNIQVANAFYTSYDYKRNLDSHMMKNTEWGAVAYLQHSKYGSAVSVRINNNDSHKTGYQANDEPTCGYTGTNEECNRHCSDGSCNTAYPNSVLASTTNNITRIYDMSGGIWEYTMGVMLNQNSIPMSGRNSIYNSGFNGPFGCSTCDGDTSGLIELINGYDFPDRKYYDIYSYSSLELDQYKIRILGDATGEMGPFNTKINLTQTRQIGSWHDDEGWSLDISNPWYHRGGSWVNSSGSGVFAAGGEPGRNNSGVGFRIVLTP